jgi:uncharacterized membrane protein
VSFIPAVESVGPGIGVYGVAVIVIGRIAAVVAAALRIAHHQSQVYRRLRQQLGRSILLGLEQLVAADIIRTVAITPTVQSVLVLAGIVLIRTFLSFSLRTGNHRSVALDQTTSRSTEQSAGRVTAAMTAPTLTIRSQDFRGGVVPAARPMGHFAVQIRPLTPPDPLPDFRLTRQVEPASPHTRSLALTKSTPPRTIKTSPLNRPGFC